MNNVLENNKTSMPCFIQYAKDMLAIEIRKITALREIISLFEGSHEPESFVAPITKAAIILESQFDKIKEPGKIVTPPPIEPLPPHGLREGLKAWSTEEDSLVMEVVKGNKTAIEVSKITGRSMPAIYTRASNVRGKIKRSAEPIVTEAKKSGYY